MHVHVYACVLHMCYWHGLYYATPAKSPSVAEKLKPRGLDSSLLLIMQTGAQAILLGGVAQLSLRFEASQRFASMIHASIYTYV